ncbi:MAG: penicillin-binding transpeptidase domain-containing protein [Pseudomonadota bacterium]
MRCQKYIFLNVLALLISSHATAGVQIPLNFDAPNESGKIQIQGKNTTLVPKIQDYMEKFIASKGNQIASVIVVEVKTGKILAMAQGLKPESWGSSVNTALHNSFPAASLFKTISSAAAIELSNLNPDFEIGLGGGCSHVMPDGSWLRNTPIGKFGGISLRKAYGLSCNGYFARLAVSDLGLGVVNDFAHRFGFDRPIPADFDIPVSPLNSPNPQTSSANTVGAFAAGFGLVGLAPVLSAWQMLAVANDGAPMPLRILEESSPSMPPMPRVISEDAAKVLRNVMSQTVLRGTATAAFRNRKFAAIRPFAGGKTGTLNGKSPEGLTTWFAGMMPLGRPEVVVTAVTVAGQRWVIKAPQIASEALWIYNEVKNGRASTYAQDGELRRRKRKS